MSCAYDELTVSDEVGVPPALRGRVAPMSTLLTMEELRS
jgi:hypothetical protein